ncbi:MAG: acetate/propionate family kinase [Armatimonadetes bacterium]|nr:acetate/propionate family kinase [Armatimonadota bacterium]
MTILVLNTGGSSLKYKLYRMPEETVLARGDIDRLGTDRAVLTHHAAGREPLREETPVPDHLSGIRRVLELLCHPEHGVLNGLAELSAVAHKLPHGGAEVSGARLVDGAVEAALERFARVVPVHNQPALTAIRCLRELLPDTPQAGTFETHFHLTHPPARYRYAVPESWYTEHAIRRYGFHSCAHRYAAGEAERLLGARYPALRLVNCHLGSGTSVCGMVDGRSVEISSAFTPQAGTPMSTRSGDFDPFVLTYLIEEAGFTAAELNRVLTKESGLLGVSGVSGDMRDIEAAAAAGNQRAQLAIDLFVVNILRWVGVCLTATRGLDVLSFSGGIGENSPLLRERVCAELDWCGVWLDPERNEAGATGVLSADDSPAAVLVVKVDEEIIVARDAAALLTGA